MSFTFNREKNKTMLEIGISKVCSAFDDSNVVGTKVVGKGDFLSALATKLKESPIEMAEWIDLDHTKFIDVVRSGVALRADRVLDDYFHVDVQGVPESVVSSEYAAKLDSLRVLVYSMDLYSTDKTVKEEELKDLKEENTDYVIVAVHGGDSAMSPQRLTSNIAGNNQNFIPNGEIEHDMELLSMFIKEATTTVDSVDKWVRVADPRE